MANGEAVDLDEKRAKALAFIEKQYEKHKAPHTSSWEEIKPRVERYIRHLYQSEESTTGEY